MMQMIHLTFLDLEVPLLCRRDELTGRPWVFGLIFVQVLGTRQVLLVSGTKLMDLMEANGVLSVFGNDGIKNYMKTI